MGVLDSINLRNFRKVMIEYAVSNAEQIAEIISQSTYDTMLKNDKSSLNHMIGKIAESKNIEHVRLINPRGKVIFSNITEEIGSVIGKHADECVMCHNAANPGESAATMNRSRIITTRSGREALAFTKAIYNQPTCFTASCHFHDAKDTVLGLLDISVSLEMLRQKSHEYRLQFIMLTCLLLLLIGILITILSHYLVDIPVQRLVRHSAKVAAGDLESRVPVTSRDELGELSDSLNRMTESLGTADRELKGWADSLEQKVAERSQEIMRMEAQLRNSEKLASLGTLAAGVAHEINNPLTGILLYASILNSDKRLEPSLLPDVERIICETERCAGIVKDLLEFSRESSPKKETVSLDAVLDDVITFFHQQPGFSTVAIEKHFHSGLAPVAVDPNQIRQVFMNIVINGGHAMPRGGKLDISTYLSTDGKYACASVTDNGCGIAEENLTKIFDPFFTTKSEGTGLGLSISHGIVTNNGGKIEVQSAVGEGTTFVVKFPITG
jgi:two-component system NtrC family sensor kinase